MLGHIIRKEIVSNLSSPAFIATFILCSGLILLSVYTGLRSYSDQVTEYRLTQALNRELLGEQKDYRGVGSQGVQLSKPPKVLGIVASGVENSLGRHTMVNAYSSDPQPAASKIEGNPVFALFGDLDLMFIVKTVLSLLAILFTYNAISGDKEDGTLRLTLSHPVPRDTLILGKIIGGFLCLMIPLAIPILLGVALITLYPEAQITGNDWGRLALIMGVFVLYMTLFFNLGIFVSARTRQSSTSFLVLLSVWVVVTLVIPKGSVIVAGQFIQVPSLHEHRIRLNQVRRDISIKNRPDFRAYSKENPHPKRPKISKKTPRAERDQINAEYKKARDEWRNKQRTWMDDHFTRTRELWEAEQAKMEQDYRNQQQSLADLAVVISRISPASAMTYATMGLAGTGIRGQEHFVELARNYKGQFAEYLQSKGVSRSGIMFSTGDQKKDPPKSVDISDMPVFQANPEPLSDILGRITIDLILMSVLSLAFFVGTYFSFLRYDVR